MSVRERANGVVARAAVLAFVREYRAQRGYPPSLNEIARGTGYAYSSVRYHVQLLVARGDLAQTANTQRTLTIRNGA